MKNFQPPKNAKDAEKNRFGFRGKEEVGEDGLRSGKREGQTELLL